MKIFTNDGLRRIGDRTVEKEDITMLVMKSPIAILQ